PVVSWHVQWQRGTAPPRAPAGPNNNLVGGTLIFTADATDASAILGLTVSVSGGLTLTPAPNNTPSHFAGTVVTGADGPLILTANTADVHGNPSSPTLQLMVDNTPPNIEVSNNSPIQNGYYSATVPVDVSTTDINGVVSFVQSGFPGLVNLSGGSRI